MNVIGICDIVLVGNALDYAETLAKTGGFAAVITDKDNIIAVSGVPKKEVVEKRVSEELEQLMEKKTVFVMDSSSKVTVCQSASLSEVSRYFNSLEISFISPSSVTSFTIDERE